MSQGTLCSVLAPASGATLGEKRQAARDGRLRSGAHRTEHPIVPPLSALGCCPTVYLYTGNTIK